MPGHRRTGTTACWQMGEEGTYPPPRQKEGSPSSRAGKDLTASSASLTLPRGKDLPRRLHSSSHKASPGLVMSCRWGPKLAFLLPWCHQEVPSPSPGAPYGRCLLLLSREASPSHLWLSSLGSPSSSFPLVFPRPFRHGFHSPALFSSPALTVHGGYLPFQITI